MRMTTNSTRSRDMADDDGGHDDENGEMMIIIMMTAVATMITVMTMKMSILSPT